MKFATNVFDVEYDMQDPKGVALESKPTTDKNTVLETGFIGNKKYAGKVNLNLSGGSLFIQ